VAKKIDFGTNELAVLNRVVDEAIESEEAYQTWQASGELDCAEELPDEIGMTKTRADSIEFEERLRRVKAKLEGGEQT
jgi:hypothetical protein